MPAMVAPGGELQAADGADDNMEDGSGHERVKDCQGDKWHARQAGQAVRPNEIIGTLQSTETRVSTQRVEKAVAKARRGPRPMFMNELTRRGMTAEQPPTLGDIESNS
jgi:hypothetical protein